MDWTNPRILIVAASPTLRFTLEELLRYYGYDVVSAASAEAALGLLAHSRFDMVLFEDAVSAIKPADGPLPTQAKPHDQLEQAVGAEWIPL
jgi:DNA-binding NtrC family response regulator